MAIGNFIESKQGHIWNRKKGVWIEPLEYTESKLMSDCSYPTFNGCNRQAWKLAKKDIAWPAQWGRLHIRHKP
jgi:hypothetical protein